MSDQWVCAECGTGATKPDRCIKCGSIRVVLESVLIELAGPNWRDYLVESKWQH